VAIDLELEEMLNRFNRPVKPSIESLKKMEEIHEKTLQLAIAIYELCPYSREKQTAFTLLQQVKMMANDSICRNQEVISE
jgi:hypothetical protein